MSTKALAWVWEHSPADGSKLLLHLALADEARDDGYISGKEFGSLTRLQDKCRFGSRQTIVAARDWLVAGHQLLMQTPAERGWGRHNEYVIVMGRDVDDLARSLGWAPRRHRRDGFDPQTVPNGEGAQSPSPRSTVGDTIPRTDEDRDAHRGAQAAAPARPVDVATEPVDKASTATPQPVRLADRTKRATGPGPVQDRSDSPDATQETQAPQTIDLTDLAHERHPDRARSAVVETGELLDDVRRQLAALAPETVGVRWDITARQVQELAVHALAWPTPAAAADDWTIAAATTVADRGKPFSARAWVVPWLYATPPARGVDEALCTEHALGELAVPSRICAPCRTAAVVS